MATRDRRRRASPSLGSPQVGQVMPGRPTGFLCAHLAFITESVLTQMPRLLNVLQGLNAPPGRQTCLFQGQRWLTSTL